MMWDEMHEAKWTTGKRVVSGRWAYYWPGDFFLVELDVRDRVTGEGRRRFRVYGDTPEWGKFRRISSATQVAEDTPPMAAALANDNVPGARMRSGEETVMVRAA